MTQTGVIPEVKAWQVETVCACVCVSLLVCFCYGYFHNWLSHLLGMYINVTLYSCPVRINILVAWHSGRTSV